MAILSVIVCVVATVLLYRVSSGLGALGLTVTILNFLSFVALSRYGRYAPVSGCTERLVGAMSMLTTLAGVVLLIVGLVKGC